MAATVWKGYLTFGLISVPIRLFTAARSERISFNQLHSKCHTRLKQQLYCPTCDRPVERSEIVKGYQYGKDQYVLVSDEEVKKVMPSSGDTMEILEFVKADDVDPLYFDKSYFTVPEEAGRKAYQLLTKTMEESGYAAIAQLSMHQREYTVLIRPREHGLTLHTMHYANEIRSVPEYGKDGDFKIKAQEQKLAKQLVESLASSFEPKKYSDHFQSRLKELIEAKRAGEETAPTETRRLAPVIDLMDALQKSLKEKKAPPKKAPARETEVAAESKASKSRKKRSRKAQ